MRTPTKLRHLPGRMATGAFILNSGLGKRSADEQTAKFLHQRASEAYPFLATMAPESFARALSTAEIALGAALLLPVIPTSVAAAGLAGFSGGLLGLYLRAPGLREPGSLRPTRDGTAIAKDVWMFGMAVGFLLDEMSRD